jgi:phosphonate transport system permease protein
MTEPSAAPDYRAILDADRQRGGRLRWARLCFWTILVIVILTASLHTARVAPIEFWQRLPQLGDWLARLWPPDFSEWRAFLSALGETLAIAVAGTVFAVLAGAPLAVAVAQTTRPVPWLALPVRGFLNCLRAIDSIIFALFFVVVVGLGPFAGVLGVACHTTGSMGKLYAEVLEGVPRDTRDAVEATGAGRLRTFLFAVLPEALPGLSGITLYLWEFNVRASMILGIVGAGGIGYELQVSIKLLDFQRTAAILLLVLFLVTLIDAASAWLRRRLA